MALEKRTGYCTSCNKKRVILRKETNHALHLLLALVTLGLWLIVWLGSAVKFGEWRCTQCGSTRISDVG